MIVGDDFIEITRDNEDVGDDRPFDNKVDKSVVESDYSDSDCSDDEDSRERSKGQKRGFLKNCYVA